MTEPYRVVVTARAARGLERIPEKIAAACVAFLLGPLADNPYRLGQALRDDLTGFRSARRGDYRVIYAVVEHRRLIEVVHIDRRGDVYR